MRGQSDGFGSFLQGKPVSDEFAHIEFSGKDELRDFALNQEIGGIAANQIFFVQANRGKVQVETAIGRPMS